MAKSVYTKEDLSKVSAEVKRQILKRIKKGEQSKATKSEAFDHIARLLKLKSARTLWQGDTFVYLSKWYEKLEVEVATIIQQDKASITCNTSKVDSETSSIDSDIQNKITKKDLLISEYEKIIKTLREENQTLRLLLIEKHGKIDL